VNLCHHNTRTDKKKLQQFITAHTYACDQTNKPNELELRLSTHRWPSSTQAIHRQRQCRLTPIEPLVRHRYIAPSARPISGLPTMHDHPIYYVAIFIRHYDQPQRRKKRKTKHTCANVTQPRAKPADNEYLFFKRVW
jgi:hypothetical protein